MLCSRCEKNEASVFYKQILNNKVTEFRLCADCAKPEGLASAGGSPVFSLLSNLGLGHESPERRLDKAECPACATRYSDFRESGFLGCARCYESFSAPIGEVLRHIHGAARHTGKSPAAALPKRRRGEEAARARKDLETAIKEERFEAAARLRDRLRSLES